MSSDSVISGEAYAGAAAAFEAIAAAEGDDVHPQARTTLLTHGNRTADAYLLLHGLTASPGQWLPFAQRLFAQGANVYVPRLPHHGLRDRMTEALENVTSHELAAFARHALRTARGLGDRLTVIGFSVGGLLTSWLAQYGPVDRAVIVAPFLGSLMLPTRFAPRVSRFVLRRRNRFLWWDPIRRERLLPEYGYPRFSTHAIAESLLLGEHLYRDALHHAPRAGEIYFVINSGETAVDNRAAIKLARAWRAHGADVHVRELSLPPSHDIIETYENASVSGRAHAELLRILRGEAV
jgi:alpha-beta hydrolase superfamily lysophospholipase